jgi:hypothetical protein
MPDKISLERTLLAEQLDFYRLQRHDFLNHWQVVMGYLQLGKAERALEYIREGLNGFEAEQYMGQIPQGTVSAIMLGFVISLRKEEIQVEVELNAQMKDASFWKEFWLEEYGQAIYGYTRECLTHLFERSRVLEHPVVQIKLNEPNGFSCHLRLLDGEHVIWEDRLTLQL